jgi:hypothetical protein
MVLLDLQSNYQKNSSSWYFFQKSSPIHAIDVLENNHINIMQFKLEKNLSNIPHLFYKQWYWPLEQHKFILIYGFPTMAFANITKTVLGSF